MTPFDERGVSPFVRLLQRNGGRKALPAGDEVVPGAQNTLATRTLLHGQIIDFEPADLEVPIGLQRLDDRLHERPVLLRNDEQGNGGRPPADHAAPSWTAQSRAASGRGAVPRVHCCGAAAGTRRGCWPAGTAHGSSGGSGGRRSSGPCRTSAGPRRHGRVDVRRHLAGGTGPPGCASRQGCPRSPAAVGQRSTGRCRPTDPAEPGQTCGAAEGRVHSPANVRRCCSRTAGSPPCCSPRSPAPLRPRAPCGGRHAW